MFNRLRLGLLLCVAALCLSACSPAPQRVTVAQLQNNAEQWLGQRVRISEPVRVADNYRLPTQGRLLVISGERWMARWQQVPQDRADLPKDVRPPSLWLEGEPLTAAALGFDNGDAEAMAAVRVGSLLHEVQGRLRQGRYGYVLELDQAPRMEPSPRQSTPSLRAADWRLGAFNLLNFFNGDGQGGGFPTERGADSPAAFAVQRGKLVEALLGLDADVLALAELENDGYGPESAIVELVEALNQRQSQEEHYAWVEAPQSRLGEQAIAVGILYRPAQLRLLGQPASLLGGVFGPESRPPLAASFAPRSGSQPFTLVAVHLKSKGGCDEAGDDDVDHGDDRGCFTATRQQSAQQLLDWLQTSPTGVAAPLVIAGDFNAYPGEPAMQRFAQAGFRRAVDVAGKSDSYSYVFRGRSGSIDHILIAPELQPILVDATAWSINADEVRTLQYDRWPLDAPITPWRSSDHDPVVASFAWPEAVQAATEAAASGAGE
jgi:hypothetical protein